MLPLRAFLLLITISVVKGHYSCPELGDIPLSTTQGCEWVVSQDWRGCLEYVEECEHHYNCEVNELMWRCSSHCAPTCRNPHPICDLECGPPACQCAGGYVRDDDGHCVRLHDCHSHEPPHLTACAANELLNTCGSMCEPTCFTDPSAPCSDVCGPPMCACRPGLVRHNGICIWRDQCPNFRSEDHHESMVGAPNNDESMIRAPNNDESMLRAPQQVQPMAFLCTANEEFVECSSLCEPTCNSPPNQPCPLGCGPPRCQCRQGFVRHEGRCIRRYECPGQGPPNPPPNRCDRNEQFVTCSSMCEPTCQSRPNDPCPLGCGPPRCECLPGFVRHYGRCIPRYECPSYGPPQRCGPNEQFVTCSSLCEPTCYSRPDEPCPLACGPPKCQCRNNYVRHNGRCIRRSECPRRRRCYSNRDCPYGNVCRYGWCERWYPGGGPRPRNMEYREDRADDDDDDLICEVDNQCPTGKSCIKGKCSDD